MILEINEENSTLPSGENPSPNTVKAHMKELTDPNSEETEASHMKREADLQHLEMAPSPQKKIKCIESREERKGKAAEKMRKMSIKERCLMMEKTIYIEEELQEILIEYQDMWDYIDEASELEKRVILARRVGNLSRVVVAGLQ